MSPSKEKSAAVEVAAPQESVMTPYVRESLDKVAAAEGFVNYKINYNASAAVGEGFSGVIFEAVLKEDGSDKTLGVIVKIPPLSRETRVRFGAMEMFEREVYAYTKVLPEFIKFQEEKKIAPEKRFTQFPKCYFAEFDSKKDESVVIMEDLKERNFVMCDKAVPASFEHAKLVFTALGRFHALSFALKTQKPEVFEAFKNLKDFLLKRLYRKDQQTWLPEKVKRASETLSEKDLNSVKRVAKLKENIEKTLAELTDPDLAEPYAVLGHGDCWLNNFMFKFENGEPSNTVLLDWQILRYVSPALDIVHFLFVCTDSDLRAKHFDDLLKIYHNSLTELLNSLGGDAEKQFPFEALLGHMKKFGKFGVFMSFVMIPLIMTKKENLPDLDAFTKETKDSPRSFLQQFSKADAGYKQRMNEILTDAIRFGFL